MTETVTSEHQESVSSSSAAVVCPIRKGSELNEIKMFEPVKKNIVNEIYNFVLKNVQQK